MKRYYPSPRKTPPRKRFIPTLSLARTAANVARAVLSSTSRTDAETRGQTTNPTDSAVTQYKAKRVKRRTAYRKKRVFRNFVKNQLKLVGSNVAVVNGTINKAMTLGAQQDFCFATLGGKSWEADSGTALGSDDIRKVLGADDRLSQNVNNTKCVINSSKMDITGINNGSVPIELDMYIIQHYGDTHMNSYWDEVTLAVNRTPLPPQTSTVGQDPNLRSRGMTLFDFPALSQMGNKIIKKVKFILPPNGTITHTMFTKKNVWFKANDIIGTSTTNIDHYVKSGYTKTIAFIYKPVTGFEPSNSSFQFGCTRSYRYKIFSDNRTFNVYNPA